MRCRSCGDSMGPLDPTDATTWACNACRRVGRDSIMCSHACFLEHYAADHPEVASQWETLPEIEVIALAQKGGA